MTLNEAGLKLIKDFEGLSLKPYLCPAGIPSIGYGNTFYEDGRRVTLKDSAITQERAESLLRDTASVFVKQVDALTRDDLTENQFAALVSFAYNAGVGNLRASTLLRMVNKDPNDPRIGVQFMRWVHSNGKPLDGLKRRRRAEADLYFKP